MTKPAEFTLAVVTREAVWLLPAGETDHRRRTRVEWELLADLANETLPVNRSRPRQAAVYKRLLDEARCCPGAPAAEKRLHRGGALDPTDETLAMARQ